MQTWLQFQQFIDWGGKAFVAGVCSLGVHILYQMKNSIDSLNIKVATIIERTESHAKELERIEERVLRLESRVL